MSCPPPWCSWSLPGLDPRGPWPYRVSSPRHLNRFSPQHSGLLKYLSSDLMPSDGLMLTLLCSFSGPSSAPGRPSISLSTTAALDNESVTDEINLKWSAPNDDGGYPITGWEQSIHNVVQATVRNSKVFFSFLKHGRYCVEMLDIKTGRWMEITFIEGYAETKCSLSNILYGIMYRSVL